jgi:predicted DNA-binding ribbon-helix-helix protein
MRCIEMVRCRFEDRPAPTLGFVHAPTAIEFERISHMNGSGALLYCHGRFSASPHRLSFARPPRHDNVSTAAEIKLVLPMLKKRSFSIAGHRTSIALEPEFWAVLEEEASRQGIALAALVAQVDAARNQRALASALRLHALERATANAAP